MMFARLACSAAVMLAAGCDEVPTQAAVAAPPSIGTLPTGAPGAVGAYLPTARGPGSRIPVTVLQSQRSGSNDAGVPPAGGQGVPL